jgi:hypothetical protein
MAGARFFKRWECRQCRHRGRSGSNGGQMAVTKLKKGKPLRRTTGVLKDGSPWLMEADPNYFRFWTQGNRDPNLVYEIPMKRVIEEAVRLNYRPARRLS